MRYTLRGDYLKELSRHPESNGRVERSHRTDDEEFYNLNLVKNPYTWKYRIAS